MQKWNGSSQASYSEETSRKLYAKTVWNTPSHDAGTHGSSMVKALLGGRKFPFPKSVYAVEDALRIFLQDRPNAIVLDFFAGSGTTAHAVMRLNKQDVGYRQSILVTNNEVGADEQRTLRAGGLRPGDPEWEARGICDYITKPRIQAAVTGVTPDGNPVEGSYKFVDEFPMSGGFEENVEFFTLTYEAPMRVQSNREFARIAPFLWLRAGSRGRRIESLEDGWDVADTYGVLADLDKSDVFLESIAARPSTNIAFIVTDEDRLFQAVVRELPPKVEPVRMYESYLSNFEIDAMRSVR
jgi:adenine-specific DNA-methyltransferase